MFKKKPDLFSVLAVGYLVFLIIAALPRRVETQSGPRLTVTNPTTGAGAAVNSDGAGGLLATLSSVTPGTGATNLGKAEEGTVTNGDVGVFMLGVADHTNSSIKVSDGHYGQLTIDNYGTLLARSDHPRRFHCTVTVSTATTLTAVGSPCSAPGAGLSLYVTDILFAASASGIAADAFPTLKYGTGGSCGTGTTVFWQALTAAAIVVQDNRTIPIKVPANNEICWITSTAGSKTVQVSGFIAP